MTKKEFTLLIQRALNERGSLERDAGVFGDLDLNFGYREEEFIDAKGFQIKYYGCKFPSKIRIDNSLIDSIAVLKRVLIVFLKYKLFFFVFRRTITNILGEACFATIENKKPLLSELSPFPRELLRVLMKKARNKSEEYIATLIVLVVQCDSAYYVRAQDFFQIFRNHSFKDSLAILMEREHAPNVYQNLKRLKLIAPFLRLRWLREIDFDIIKHDENDLYFAYRKHLYDTNGLSYEERRKMVDKWDEGNYIIEERKEWVLEI